MKKRDVEVSMRKSKMTLNIVSLNFAPVRKLPYNMQLCWVVKLIISSWKQRKIKVYGVNVIVLLVKILILKLILQKSFLCSYVTLNYPNIEKVVISDLI